MAGTASITLSTREKLERSRIAAAKLAQLSTPQKNELLLRIAEALEANLPQILRANEADIQRSNLAGAMRDRLLLTPPRISEMAHAVREVAGLADPVNEVIEEWTRPNGLLIR